MLLWVLCAACRSAEEWRRTADDEVYELVAARRAEIVSHADEFTIDRPADLVRDRDETASVELGVLALPGIFELAAHESREYRAQREDLYLAALDLTLERHQFENQYSGGVESFVRGSPDADLVEATPFAGLRRVLETGAELVLDVGVRVFKDLSNGDSWDLVTDLGLDFTQPLLRGAGKRIARERLTQAERTLVYAVRRYERFRRTFAFDVASRAFRILQQHDVIANERVNLASLTLLRERNEALAEAGRLSDIQVDQAFQDELRSQNRIVVEEARLEGQMDDFKLFLGLPIQTSLEVDPGIFEGLGVEQAAWTTIAEDLVVSLALERRLDYMTSADRADDAARQAHVAADALRAGLDLEVIGDISSQSGQPFDFDIDDLDWQVNLDLDLPFERTAERNAYREALIGVERSRRDLEEAGDTIERDVRSELRDVRSTRETYDIQQRSVELAERRVESAQLNFDAGRATTRDLLEAREDLLSAQNAATEALVDHYLSLLSLYRDMEVLRVEEDGLSVDPEALALLAGAQP